MLVWLSAEWVVEGNFDKDGDGDEAGPKKSTIKAKSTSSSKIIAACI